MKKILSYTAYIVLIVFICVMSIVIINHNNNKNHKLIITTDYYGSTQVQIDNYGHSVKLDSSKVYTVTRKNKIILTAVPEDGCSFVEWKINGLIFSNDPKITLTITNSTEIKAVFKSNIDFS